MTLSSFNGYDYATFITAIGTILGFFFTIRRSLRKEINEIKMDVEKKNKEQKGYTDNEIIKHEKADENRYQGIKDMFEMVKNDLGEIKEDLRRLK